MQEAGNAISEMTGEKTLNWHNVRKHMKEIISFVLVSSIW